MKLGTALTALAFLSGSAGLAHAAQTIASPPMQTVTNTAGACYIRNVSTHPVSVQISPLINFTPNFTTATFEDCNEAPLQPGHTCVLLIDDLDDDVTFACSAVITGNAKNVRGSIEIRSITASGLQTILADELR